MYQQTMAPNYGGYYPQQPQIRVPQVLGLKGRPVSSLDEVRATAVDFDGTIFYFPDIANNKIYTKQINLDGTSSIKVYELSELPQQIAATPAPHLDLVTKEEFNQTINSLLEEISALKESNSISEENVQESEQPQQTTSTGFNF